MTIEQLQEISILTDLIHRTDDKDIQDKFKQLVNIRLDALLKEQEE